MTEPALKIEPREISAVVFSRGGSFDRRYWIAWLLGWTLGPVLMSVFNFKLLRFGVYRGGKFRWIEVER